MIGIVARISRQGDVTKLADHLARNGNDVQAKTARLVGIYGLKIEREAKRAAGVVTNILRSSITTEIRTSGKETSARVGTNVKYAPHVNYGTGLWGPKHSKYEIRPRYKKALAWATPVGREMRTLSGGRVQMGRNLYRNKRGRLTARGWDRSRVSADVVVMAVHHPGSPGQYFLLGSPTAPFERNAPLFQADLQTMLRNLARV